MNVAVRFVGIISIIGSLIVVLGILAIFIATKPVTIVAYKNVGEIVLPNGEENIFTFKVPESGKYTLYLKPSGLPDGVSISDEEMKIRGEEIIKACNNGIDLDCAKQIFKENISKEIDRGVLLGQCDKNPYGAYCRDVLQYGEMKWEIRNSTDKLLAEGDYKSQGYYDVTDGVQQFGKPIQLQKGEVIKIKFFKSSKHHPLAVPVKQEILLGIRKSKRIKMSDLF